MRNIKILGTLLMAAFFLECSSSKYGREATNSTSEWFLSVEQTPCFGKCPIYLLSVDGLGISYFDGKRFVQPVGKYTSSMTDSLHNELMALTSTAKWEAYDKQYVSGYADLPSTIIRYSAHAQDTFTITFEKNLAPTSLVHLAGILQEYSLVASWKPLKN